MCRKKKRNIPNDEIALRAFDALMMSGVPKEAKCLYFFANEPLSLLKIGIAKIPGKRIRTLECQSGMSLDFMACSTEIVGTRKYEAKMHHHFKEHRKEGEWFDLKIKDRALDYAKKIGLNMQVHESGWWGEWRSI